jgi:hypothetical protein
MLLSGKEYKLEEELKAWRQRKKSAKTVNALVILAHFVVGWFLLLHLVDWIFILPSGARQILASITLLAVPVFILFLVVMWLRTEPFTGIARDIEKAMPEMKQELTTAVQFGTDQGGRENYSQQLIEDLVIRTERKLGTADRRDIFPIKTFPYGKVATYGLALMLLVSLAVPGELTISTRRYLSPDGIIGDWSGIEINPGDLRVAKGGSLKIDVAAPISRKQRLVLKNYSEQTFRLLKKDVNLSADITDIQKSFSYRILLGRWQSKYYYIDCYQPLLLTDVNLKVIPPSYTDFPAMQLENQGNVTAIKGTRIEIEATATVPLEKAVLQFENGRQLSMRMTDGRSMQGKFYVTSDQGYRIWGESAEGDTFVNAGRYQISCLDDRIPKVEITSPQSEAMLGDDMMVQVAGTANDDFGLSGIGLGYISQGQEKRLPIGKFSATVDDTIISYVWDVGKLNVLPGDSVVLWLEATDNDIISGPKTGRSQVRVLRVPTVEDMYRELVQADSVMADQIVRTDESRSELKEEIDKLAQSLKEARKMDWQQQAAAEQVIKKQQELTEQMEKAMEQASQSLKERESKWEFDQETMEKLAELRDLFDQVATDRMRQDMEKLRQALDKMDKKEVSQALENLKLSQEDFKRQLDQTMALLKELQQEQQMEKLDRQLQEMVQQQQELKEQTERSDKKTNQRLSSEQEDLGKKLDRMSSEMGDLSKDLAENNREVSQKLEENMRRMEQNGTARKMQKASESLAGDKNQQASEMQQQVLSELSMISSGLQSARSSMRQARNQAAAKAVQQKARDLLDLSRQQESLNQSAAGSLGENNDLANQQQIIKRQAERIRQELDNMARRNMLLSPRAQQMMQEAARQMEQAGQAYSQGLGDVARKGGQKALASLNGAAISLMESSNSSGGGSGDMIQDLSGLSGQQQAVNDGTNAMLPMMQNGGGQLSQQARSQMARMAAGQEAIRQGMEGFNEKYGGRRDMAGRLDNLVEEMKQVIEDLKKQNVNRQTIERQERILTRMLDAQHSLKDRDFSRERKAETGQPPGGDVRQTEVDKGKWDGSGLPAWRNWRQEYYPLEYKEILEEYFRSLGQ